jgi:sugar phosphate isomerase/epimerase
MREIKLCAFADEASVDLEGQIKALKRNNISLLEIRGVDGENIKEISLPKIKEIKKRLDDNNIKVWSIGSPVGKYNVEESFDNQLEEFKRLCEYAHILGASRIRMFSFFTKDKEKAFSGLESFCKEAPDDIIMCHENEKGIFGDDIESCLAIHKEFDRIKMVFDPANFIQCGVDTKEAWSVLNGYVDYMHIKDALKDKRVVRAGYGIGNVKELVSMYKGEVLTLEPHLMEFCGLKGLENGESVSGLVCYDDTNTAFDAGADALKKILDELEIKY